MVVEHHLNEVGVECADCQSPERQRGSEAWAVVGCGAMTVLTVVAVCAGVWELVKYLCQR